MKGSIFCASGNDFSFNALVQWQEKNKLVPNNLVKEMRAIWHHVFLNLPQWEGAGRAGTLAFQKEGTLLERCRKKRRWPEPK